MKRFKAFITSDTMAFISIISGTYIGMNYPKLAENFKPMNDIYIQLFQLVILPFLVATIIVGIFNLVTHEKERANLPKMFLKTLGMFIIVIFLILTIAYIMKPWISMVQSPDLLKVVYRNEPIIQPQPLGLEDIVDPNKGKGSFGEFMVENIPDNIFHALSEGQLLQITIFCVIFATGLGFWSRQNRNISKTQYALDNVLDVLQIINNKMLLALPIMSFFMIAYQLRGMSIGVFSTLFILLETILLTYLSMLVLFLVIIRVRSKTSFFKILKALKSTIMVSLLSRSTFIASSTAMESLTKELGFEPNTVKLVMPLGISVIRFASLGLYGIGALLTIHLFEIEVSTLEYAFSFVLLIFASIVSVGTNNPVAFYQNIAIILNPLGVPSNAVNSIFLSIDVILDPFDALVNVLGLCALTALCAEPINKIKA